jgi:hypothetical protein
MSSYRDESERRAEVLRWRSSGLSATRYCATHGISLQSLRRWRLEVDAVPALARKFVRVELARATPVGGLTVEVGAARVRVENGFDAALLRSVVRALGEAT